MVVLGLGDAGFDVILWQTFLCGASLGYRNELQRLERGKFGSITEAATKEFQRGLKLTPTGRFDLETQARVSKQYGFTLAAESMLRRKVAIH